MIFFIFENFLRNQKKKKKKKKKKKMKFSPIADLGTFLAQLTHVLIFHPSE